MDSGKNTILRVIQITGKPQLDYCIQVWNPYEKHNIEQLDKVQKQAFKQVYGYKDLSNEESYKWFKDR